MYLICLFVEIARMNYETYQSNEEGFI